MVCCGMVQYGLTSLSTHYRSFLGGHLSQSLDCRENQVKTKSNSNQVTTQKRELNNSYKILYVYKEN